MKLLFLLLSLLLLLANNSSMISTYGNFAHRLIAMLTWQQLSPSSRNKISKVLAPNGKSFVGISTWADSIKHVPGYEWSQRLHFADFQGDPPKECIPRLRDALEPSVISASIKYSLRVAKGKGGGITFQDFAFMVHFVMDLHMPLHCKFPYVYHSTNYVSFKKSDRKGQWWESSKALGYQHWC